MEEKRKNNLWTRKNKNMEPGALMKIYISIQTKDTLFEKKKWLSRRTKNGFITIKINQLLIRNVIFSPTRNNANHLNDTLYLKLTLFSIYWKNRLLLNIDNEIFIMTDRIDKKSCGHKPQRDLLFKLILSLWVQHNWFDNF